MKNIIFVVVLLIILILIYYYDNKIENFNDMNKCYLYKFIDNDYCKSKYGNMGELQLLYNIAKMDDKNKIKNVLIKVYDLKERHNLFDRKCKYILNKLEMKDDNYKRYFKTEDDDKFGSKNAEEYLGNSKNWLSCKVNKYYSKSNDKIYSIKDEKDDNYNIYFDKMFDETKEEICKNKGFFINEGNNINVNDKFLRIECKKMNKKSNLEDLKIGLINIRICKLENNKIFKELDNGVLFSENFLSISNDKYVIKLVSMLVDKEVYIIEKDICDDIKLKEKLNMKFDLSLIGLNNIYITDNILNLEDKTDNIENNIGKLNERENGKNIIDELNIKKDNLIEEIKDEINKCVINMKNKKSLYKIYKSDDKNYKLIIRNLNIKLKEIYKYRENLKNIDRNNNNFINEEKNVNKICKLNDYNISINDINNKNNELKKCKNKLIMLPNNEEYNEIIGKMDEYDNIYNNLKNKEIKYKPLLKFYEKKEDIKKRIILENSIFNSVYNGKNSICNYGNNSRKEREDEIVNQIEIINNDIFMDKDLEQFDNKNNIIDNKLLEYISEDNCIYIKI